MSKAEIVEELPKLTPDDRDEIRQKLAELDQAEWLDEDDPLSVEEIALIEDRFAEHEKCPETAISWEEFSLRLQRRLEG